MLRPASPPIGLEPDSAGLSALPPAAPAVPLPGTPGEDQPAKPGVDQAAAPGVEQAILPVTDREMFYKYKSREETLDPTKGEEIKKDNEKKEGKE